MISASRSGAKKDMIPQIDGLRGVAICAVMFHHLFSESLTAMNLRPLGVSLNPLLANGGLGVFLFFMLSGFVLYLPYARGQRTMTGASSWRSFYKHRALRLLPAYYLATLAALSLTGRAPFGDWLGGLQTVSLMTLTFPFIPSVNPTSVNWVLWSIGTELLFSAAFPLLCIASLRWGAISMLAIAIPVCTAIRYGAHQLPGSEGAWLSDELMIGRIDEFLWGFALAQLMLSQRLPKRPYILLGAATVTMIVVLWAITRNSAGLMPRNSTAWLYTALDIGFALTIAAALSAKSAFSVALSFPPLRLLGMGCYSLYLWHFPILVSLRLHVDPWNGPNLLAFAIFLFSIAAISYRFVEFRSVSDWRSLFFLGPSTRRSVESPSLVDPIAEGGRQQRVS